MKRLLIILLLLISIGLNATSQGFVSSKSMWFNGNNSYIATNYDIVARDKYTVVIKLEWDTLPSEYGSSKYLTSFLGVSSANDAMYITSTNTHYNIAITKHKKSMLTFVADSVCDSSIVYYDNTKYLPIDPLGVVIPLKSDITVGKASSNSLLGTIYDFQFYHAVLDSFQIAYIYNHRLPLNHDSLKIWYDFQHYNPTGDSIYDQSRNNNHGKIYNCELRTGSFVTHGVK